MNMQTCPKCGEANPDEAVMCWACYTPLSEKGAARATTIHHAQPLRWLPLLSGGALILYGLARRSRSGLGCALLGSGLVYLSTNQHRPKPAEEEDGGPIVRIVNTILMYAINDKASEIHVEPQPQGVLIRYRIDDVWRDQMKVPTYVLKPMVQRIKIMGDLNILEHCAAQSGCIHVSRFDKQHTVHVDTSPTEFGEKIMMSFVDTTEAPVNSVIW